MDTPSQEIGGIERIDLLLEQDASGVFKKQYLDGLANYKAVLKKTIDSGLSTKEFEIANKAKSALDVAEGVINSVWASMHAS